MYDSPEKSRAVQAAIQIDNPAELRRKALERSLDFFKTNLPKVESFRGVDGYNDRILEKDIYTTNKLSAEYKDMGDDLEKQWSVIQEAVILNESELSNWFGSDTRTIRPSDHADYVQQVDGILEFPNDTKVAFDATFSKNPYQKIHKNKEFVDAGNLHPITYFEDDEKNFKGSIEVPKVVIGFGKENLLEITKDWLSAQEGLPGSKAKLAEHPVQMLLIYQVLMQFSAAELYAKNTLHDEDQTDLYKNLREQMLDVYNQKAVDNPELKEYQLDNFTENLINDVRREFGLKLEDIKNNIWPPKATGKVFKVLKKPSGDQAYRAAA
jgi:hypothetical protein